MFKKTLLVSFMLAVAFVYAHPTFAAPNSISTTITWKVTNQKDGSKESKYIKVPENMKLGWSVKNNASSNQGIQVNIHRYNEQDNAELIINYGTCEPGKTFTSYEDHSDGCQYKVKIDYLPTSTNKTPFCSGAAKLQLLPSFEQHEDWVNMKELLTNQ